MRLPFISLSSSRQLVGGAVRTGRPEPSSDSRLIMRLRKLGHSCLVFEDAGSRILIDPGCFAAGLEDLTGLTGVLVTHIHDDHFDIARLSEVLEANADARVICDEASAGALRERGVAAEVARAGDAFDLGTSVHVYGSDHAVIHPDLPSLPNVGYLMAGRFFVAGDAFTVPDERVEVLAVPVGAAWMKVSDAIDWMRTIRPDVAVPVHDYGNVFADWIYHLLEQLSPSGMTVTVLEGDGVATL